MSDETVVRLVPDADGRADHESSDHIHFVISRRGCLKFTLGILIVVTIALIFMVDWGLGQTTFARNMQLMKDRLVSSSVSSPPSNVDYSPPPRKPVPEPERESQKADFNPYLSEQLDLFHSQNMDDDFKEMRMLWRVQTETPEQMQAIQATLNKALRYIQVPGVAGLRDLPYLTVIAGTYSYRQYVLNMLCIMHRVGIRNPLVISLDRELSEYLNKISPDILTVHFRPPHGVDADIDAMFEDHASTSDVVIYSSKGFADVTSLKIYAVYRLIQLGYHVVFSDSDIMFCRDAAEVAVRTAEYTLQHMKSDIVFQSDYPGNMICTGFYYVRPTWKSMYFLETVMVKERAYSSEDDQSKINRLLCDAKEGGKSEGFKCFRGSFEATMYSLEVFNNGAYELSWRDQPRKRLWYYPRELVMEACKIENEHGRVMLHNNHIWPGGKKKDRFIVKGFWFIKDDVDSLVKTTIRYMKSLAVRAEHVFIPWIRRSDPLSLNKAPVSRNHVSSEYTSDSSYTSKFCNVEPHVFDDKSFEACGSDCGDK